MVYPDKKLDVRACLAATCFGEASKESLDDLCRVAKVERFRESTLLELAGQPLEYLRLVVSGSIEIRARQSADVDIVAWDIGAGGWAPWLATLMQVTPDNDIHCTPSSCFVALPVKTVRQLLANEPQIYPQILKEMGERMRLLIGWTSQSILAKPDRRMAKLILLLAELHKLGDSQGSLQITQKRLADLARCSRQTANALLGMLEERGLVGLTYGKVEIKNFDDLVEFANGER